MNFTVVFNLSHLEDHVQYQEIYEILEKEYHLKHYELQEERKVLTPNTTVVGENSEYNSARDLADSIIDRLQKEEITLDRILVSRSNDYILIG